MLRGVALAMILLVVGGLLGFVALRMDWDHFPKSAFGAQGLEYGPPEDEVRRTEFHKGRLWVLVAGGQLFSLAEGEQAPRAEFAGSRVLDLCQYGGELHALSVAGDAWILHQREGAAWPELARARSEDDVAIALVCGDRPELLTDRRLVDLTDSRRSVRLLRRLPTVGDNLTARVGDDVLFGTTLFEYGTRLYRIRAATGDIASVRSDGADDMCGALINDCKLVTDAIAAPWNPDCAVLTQRSFHIGVGGRVLELCGSAARRLYEGPCFHSPDGTGCTEEFNSVIARTGDVVAAGSNGLTQIDEAGVGRRLPMPPLRDYGPFQAAFGPGFVAVETAPDPRPRRSPPQLLLTARPV